MTDDRKFEEFEDALRNQPRYLLSAEATERHLKMLADLAAQPDPAPKPHTPRARRLIWLGAAITVLAGAGAGTAAALGLFAAPPTDRGIAHCYTTADLNDPNNHTDFAVMQTPSDTAPSLHDAAASALDICRGGWLQGRFSATDPKIVRTPQAPPWNYPVPPLVACVLPSGQVGVFPGPSETCGNLSLPNALT